MIRNTLVVAALLLTGLPTVAAAADNLNEQQSKNAQKVLATLNTLGITDPDIKDFITESNKHIQDGYLNLNEEKMWGGNVALRYQLDGISSKRLELSYTPDDSHIHCTLKRDGLMVQYHLKLN